MKGEDRLTLEQIWKRGTAFLEEKGVPDAGLDAWYLMEEVWQIDRAYYYTHRDDVLEEDGNRQERFADYLKRRGMREPLQHILGRAWFMELEFVVNPHVLIPRQDTETLVEEALKVLEPGMEVLDLCTGSGCIVISLLKHARVGISGTASDISKQALLIAKENAKQNQVETELVRSDLFQNITGKYDVIISNPPYIPTGELSGLMPEVRDFEPLEALDGAEDGLFFYREITRMGKNFLKSNGYLYFEIGHNQGRQVAFLMEKNGFRNIKVIKDLAGNDRVAFGNLPAVK